MTLPAGDRGPDAGIRTIGGMLNDPFEELGLPARFDLDAAVLERAFLRRAASVHPDMASEGGSAAEAGETENRAAALNVARAILADPEKRANALLAKLGGPTKEQDKSLPPGFLMEIMETRQEVEADLAGADPSERDKWRGWAADRRRDYAARVGGMFASLDAQAAPAALGEIRRELNAWRYIERLIEQLNPEYDPGRADW